MKNGFKIRVAVILCIIMTVVSAVAYASEIPVSQTVANIDGVQTMTRIYIVDSSIDPNSFIQEECDIEDFHYALFSLTKDTKTHSVEKEQSLNVQYALTSKKLADATNEALRTVKSSINYEDYAENPGNMQGELLINLGSLSVTPVNERTVYGTKSLTKTYTMPYNDNNQIPEKISDGGYDYSLAGFQWSEGKLDEESLMPSEYICSATYTRGTSGVANDGYIATVEYRGRITDIDVIEYTAIYHGTEIVIEPEVPEEPPKRGLFGNADGGVVNTISKIGFFTLCGLLLAAGLFFLITGLRKFFSNVYTIMYRDEFSGADKVYKRKFLNNKDLSINIDTSKHPECQHYKVILNKRKTEPLIGQTLVITADLHHIDHTITACYDKKYEIEVNLEETPPETPEKETLWQKAI